MWHEENWYWTWIDVSLISFVFAALGVIGPARIRKASLWISLAVATLVTAQLWLFPSRFVDLLVILTLLLAAWIAMRGGFGRGAPGFRWRMRLLPVVMRELRVQARYASTYWFRIAVGLALLAAGGLFYHERGLQVGNGSALFSAFHWAVFVTIWCIVPLAAADCLSREKREGTLGLLRLTPLLPGEIALAKGLVHGLRGATLILAALPVAAIAFVLGGLDWKLVVTSLFLNFTSLALALAAGLLASALSFRWGRAMVVAAVLTVFIYLQFSGVVADGLQGRQYGKLSNTFGMAFFLSIRGHEAWSYLFHAISNLAAEDLRLAAKRSVFHVLFVMAIAVGLAAHAIRTFGREKRQSKLAAEYRAVFLAPVYWRDTLKRWLNRTLDRNPVGWLERRTWAGRAAVWAWLAVMLTLWVQALTGWGGKLFDHTADGILTFLACLMIGSLTMRAAGSFGRERETGVMELLLVAPLGERRIIAGRLSGLWLQFGAATALLLGLWAYSVRTWGTSSVWLWFFVVAFWTLPVIGLYFSLRCRSLLVSLLWTMGTGLVLPLLANMSLRRLHLGALVREWLGLHSVFLASEASDSGFRPLPFLADLPVAADRTLVPIVIQVLIAVILGACLHRNLIQRRFAMERS